MDSESEWLESNGLDPEIWEGTKAMYKALNRRGLMPKDLNTMIHIVKMDYYQACEATLGAWMGASHRGKSPVARERPRARM